MLREFFLWCCLNSKELKMLSYSQANRTKQNPPSLVPLWDISCRNPGLGEICQWFFLLVSVPAACLLALDSVFYVV